VFPATKGIRLAWGRSILDRRGEAELKFS